MKKTYILSCAAIIISNISITIYKSEVPETELIKHGTEYVVEKVVIENSGEKYYFIEMFVNENPCVKQVSADDFEIISEYQIPLDISRRG